jgi:lysozyme
MSDAAAVDATRWPDPSLPWPLPYATAVLPMAKEEQGPGGGVALKSYRCPAGRWTCGWGETDGVGPNMRWTKEYSDMRLCDSLTERTHAVRALCKVEPTPNQLAALVRCSYNIGVGALGGSSIIAAHNRGDFAAAANAFRPWNKARNRKTGKLEVMPGLVARRAAEAALYLAPEPDEAPARTPQAVAPEPSLAASPTMASGTALVGTGGTLAVLADAGSQAGQAKGALDGIKAFVIDTIGIPPNWWLPTVLILLGGLIVYRRYRQRRQGLA